MKKILLFASALAVLGLTACEKGLGDDIGDVGNGQVKNSVLQVRTRGASGYGATVAYPVAVYVFEGDKCKASQTIGGASADDYVLPGASEALATSAIALREGHGHGDLMTASATVTLMDGEANTVTLGMERCTMLLQSVVMKKIPMVAMAVSVSVAPLWQSLTVGGNYAGTDGSYSLNLEKQSDVRTWQSTETTLAELNAIYSASETANGLFETNGGTTLTNARRYFYTDADGNLLYRALSTPDMSGNADFPTATYVRPVTIITKQ